MAESLEMKNKFYEWSHGVFGKSPFDLKPSNLLAMAAALGLGNGGAVSYCYFLAKKAGATPSEPAPATDIAMVTARLNRYTLLPKE
jgi:hypothetical protein